MKGKYIKFALLLSLISICTFSIAQSQPKNLSNTSILSRSEDLSSPMAQGISSFLDRKISKSVDNRAKYWFRDFSNSEAYNCSVLSKFKQHSQILGIVDRLKLQTDLEYVFENKVLLIL